MSRKHISYKYGFYSALVISIASTLITSMALVFNKDGTQSKVDPSNTTNSNTNTSINQPQNISSTAKSLENKDSNLDLIPTFAYTFNKSTGKFEIICQVKKDYGCDLYSNSDNQKVLIKKYKEANIESIESEPIKNVKWLFNISSWSYGPSVILVTTNEKGENIIESASTPIASVLGIGGN